MPKYRFFYHFRKGQNKMSVHFRDQCMGCKDVICKVPCQTKWNKRQPYLVMQGFASKVRVVNNVAMIT